MSQESDYLIMMDGKKVNVVIKKVRYNKIKVKENGKKAEYNSNQKLIKEIYWAKKDQRILSIAMVASNLYNGYIDPQSNIGFLPIVLDGRIRIFKLEMQDTKNTLHIKYYISKDSDPARKIPDVAHNLRTFVNKKNRKFFREYVEDCPRLAAKFTADVNLSSKEFLKVIEEYNSVCPNK